MKPVSAKELLGLQFRVFAGLLLRETGATFGNSSFGYFWAIISPTASIGFLVFIFSLAGRQPPFGASFALFFASGLLTLQFFNELSSKLLNVFEANRALRTYPIVKDVDTVFARFALIMCTYFMIMVLFYVCLLLFGLMGYPNRPEQVLLAFFATALLGLGFGLLNAVIVSLWDTWRHVEKILTRPLFFISGVFYVPSQLPKQAREVLQWNPVLQLVEWAREGFYPNYNSLIFNPWYPIFVGTFMLLAGLFGERAFRRLRH